MFPLAEKALKTFANFVKVMAGLDPAIQ